MTIELSTSPAVSPEFELPGKVQQLLSRVLGELVQPCSQLLAGADCALAGALEAAEAVLSKVKSQVESAQQEQQRELKSAEAQIETALADIRGICGQAEAYLKTPRAAEGGKRSATSAAATTATAIRLDTDSLQRAIAPLRARSEEIQRRTGPAYWPQGTGARWLIVLSSLFVFSLYRPLIFTWPVIVFALRATRSKSARDDFNRLIADKDNLEASLEASRRSARNECQRAIASVASLLGPARDEHARAVGCARAAFASGVQRINDTAAPLAAELHEEAAQLWVAAAYAGADWRSPAWDVWAPDPSPEFAARLGTFHFAAPDLESRLPGIDFRFQLPALIPFADGRCLLFNTTPRTGGAATAAMQSVVIRVLANTPPGKARFTFIDPVGLGQNVADFMRLGDYDERLINGKAWTEVQHIEQQLADLTEHMETVIQKYLRTDFATIREYNAQAHEVAEPFRFLVIFDFPVNFSETAARRLVSIVRNGPRCGVYTFVIRDTSKPLPYGFNLGDLEQAATIINWEEPKSSGAAATWAAGDFSKVLLIPDTLEGHREVAGTIIAKSGQTAVAAMKVEVPFEALLAVSERGELWVQSAARNLRAPLGPSGARKLQHLTFGEGLAHHGLIVGRTGSGKTNLMHVMIAGLALLYPPQELQLYLIDFKGGVGFKPYADHALPHAAVIAIESEREFGISVLQGLDDELQRRFELFRAAGVDNLADYREKAKQSAVPGLPRILLVVDEFQELFSRDDGIAVQAKAIFDRMVRQGRSFGLHILLGTQSLAGSAQLPMSTMGQMAVRIALPCSDADARLILADDNVAARSLSRPGEAIYNSAAGLVEANSPFQAARLGDDGLQRHLKIVSALATERGVAFRGIVFEGNEPATLPECKPLSALIEAPKWPAPPKAPAAWLGEPVAVLPPVAGIFRRQTGKHLLIVSRDEGEGVGALYAAYISLLCQHCPTTARFYVMDLSTADSSWASYSSEVRSLFGHEIEKLDRRNTATVLGSLSTAIKRRIESPGHADVPIFIVISGLHRARDLRAVVDSYYSASNAQPTPADLLAEILRDGPEAGVHVLAWCDTVPNARRALDRAFGEFGMRLAGPMSAEDSNLFLDCSDASRLDRPHRLIFCDEERPGVLQKLRPYSVPGLDWLRSVAAQQGCRPHE